MGHRITRIGNRTRVGISLVSIRVSLIEKSRYPIQCMFCPVLQDPCYNRHRSQTLGHTKCHKYTNISFGCRVVCGGAVQLPKPDNPTIFCTHESSALLDTEEFNGYAEGLKTW